MVKQKINKELFPRHFQTVLAAYKGKSGAQFEQESSDMPDQPLFDVAFLRLLGPAQKVENVGVFRLSLARSDCGAGSRSVKFVTAWPCRSRNRVSTCMTSTLRDQSCSIALAAYHSRSSRVESLSKSASW